MLLNSCAHKATEHKQESAENLDGVLNIAKTSYIRGCIEGMNELIPLKSNGKRLEVCVKKSEFHQLEIKSILYSSDHLKPLLKNKKAAPPVNGLFIRQR